MTDTEFLPSGPAFSPRRAVELDPEAQRREAALDADLNVGRIADALEGIRALLSAGLTLRGSTNAALDRLADLLEPEPEPDERTGEPDPEPPIDAAPAWAPVKGGRAILQHFDGKREPVVVDRLFESEGETWAVAVDAEGEGRTVHVSHLEPPR